MDTSFRLAQSAAIVATDEGNSNKCVSEVQWSPTRRGVLAVSSVDSPRILSACLSQNLVDQNKLSNYLPK